MKLRYSLAAGAALVVAAAFASPALAIEQVHIPDSSAAQSSGPPDALFDKSVPTTWQKKADQNANGGMGGLHFSVSGGSQYGGYNGFGQSTGVGEDATTPGSEFHTNGTPVQPLYQPQ